MKERHIVLAITGASGAVYGLRLVEELLAAGCRVSLLVSRAGFAVLAEECDLAWAGDAEEVTDLVARHFQTGSKQLCYYREDDFFAPFASGSAAPDAMVVCPCSMGSLGRIAAGLSNTLLERCADVMLKEGRPLLLVPRETPLSAIHLENMLKLARLGCRIIPAMPAFYHHPTTIADQVDFVVGKVLNNLAIPHKLFKSWGGK
ncbi:MAG TPA: flavin prenyltransferase UbiX [Geobacteraceae bacterium]